MATQHANITEADLHESKGVSTAATGSVLTAAGGVGAWSFPQYMIDLDIVSLNTVTAYHVISPFAGTISHIVTVIDSAIATADTTITTSIGGTNVTNGVVTIAYSGSAAGDTDIATPTALNTVTEHQAIKLTVNGASTGAARCHVQIHIQRTA